MRGTMPPTSSCGTRLSPTAIGYTGLSYIARIDWERDLYVVLLTNRVHPTRENDAMRRVRPRFTTRWSKPSTEASHRGGGGHGAGRAERTDASSN